MTPTAQRHQHGIALTAVMVILVVCTVIVFGSARTGLLQEMLAGNQSDQLRAQTAAEALIQDAESDIRGMLPNGRACREAATTGHTSPTEFVGCRQRGGSAQAAAPYFPQDADEFDEVRRLLDTKGSIPCQAGICVPADMQVLDHLEDRLPEMTPLAATYGQFTHPDLPGASAAGNPVLASKPPRAWYWVEAFRYDIGPDALAATNGLSPDAARPFVYRITAVAVGLKPATRAVVKSFFVPYPSEQLP